MSESELDYDDLSAEPLDPDHLFEYVMKHHDSERLAKLATGVNLARRSSSGLGELSAENNLSKLREEYDVTYSELLDGARQYSPDVTPERAIEHIEEYGGKSSLAEKSRQEWEQRAENETETETDDLEPGSGAESLGRALNQRLAGRCRLMPVDWIDAMEEIADKFDDEPWEPDDLAVARHEDVMDVLEERQRLTDAVDLPDGEAESLALSSLRRLAGNSESSESLAPNPRSGDPQAVSDDETRYSNPREAEEIREKLEALEHGSGPLIENARDHWRKQLSALEE